jgi:hypothetical protein
LLSLIQISGLSFYLFIVIVDYSYTLDRSSGFGRLYIVYFFRVVEVSTTHVVVVIYSLEGIELYLQVIHEKSTVYTRKIPLIQNIHTA